MMLIWSPTQPDDSIVSSEVAHTSITIKTRFRKNYFPNVYGLIIAYTIIRAEDVSKPTNNIVELPSWLEVQHESIWPQYQAVDP